MSMRRQFIVGVLAAALVAALGMSAARDLAPIAARSEPGIWLDNNAPDELLASRLNLTNVAKRPLTR
jgi:hypothetical protein